MTIPARSVVKNQQKVHSRRSRKISEFLAANSQDYLVYVHFIYFANHELQVFFGHMLGHIKP